MKGIRNYNDGTIRVSRYLGACYIMFERVLLSCSCYLLNKISFFQSIVGREDVKKENSKEVQTSSHCTYLQRFNKET